MDVREKLVELLKSILPNFRNNMAYWGEKPIYEFADCLLANGVTVQEWISVDDRLPDKNTTVIVTTDKGIVFQCLYAYDGWDLWDGNEINITHWMPLPEPPKGE